MTAPPSTEGFANPKLLMDLCARDCRWPGDSSGSEGLLYCAAPVLDGHSYCLVHCRIAYNKPGATPRAPR